MPEITWDRAVGQWVAFVDKIFKIAVVNTQHHQGLVKNGVLVYEAMPRSSWTIHFTSPSLPVEVVEAVMASLPKEA